MIAGMSLAGRQSGQPFDSGRQRGEPVASSFLIPPLPPALPARIQWGLFEPGNGALTTCSDAEAVLLCTEPE